MTSLTIDASVFALKQEDNDIEEEYKNIQQFILNIFFLQLLEKECPSVTVSYMNFIADNLVKDSLFPKDIKERIEKVKNSYQLSYYAPDLLDFFHDTYSKIICKSVFDDKTQTKKINKGKIGIYENIPSRDSEPSGRKYKDISYNDKIYPFTNYNLKNYFKLYLGFVAELNNKYCSSDNNYIVIGGNNSIIQENVTLCFSGFNQSKVNIIGIQNIKILLEKTNKEIIDINNEIINIPDTNIVLGQNVLMENLQDLKSINFYTKSRLYYYLKTLNDIMNILNKNKIDKNEQNLIFICNSHGCLTSPDDEKYKECRCPHRYYLNENGEPEYFSIHLKPITETKLRKLDVYTLGGDEYNKSIRIYIKIKNQNILIGMVGKHPETCVDCIRQYECMKKSRNNSSLINPPTPKLTGDPQ